MCSWYSLLGVESVFCAKKDCDNAIDGDELADILDDSRGRECARGYDSTIIVHVHLFIGLLFLNFSWILFSFLEGIHSV